MTTEYLCSACGGSSTEINDAHPSLDERYKVGYCAECCPNPSREQLLDGKKRKLIALVHKDVFDREEFKLRQKTLDARKKILMLSPDYKKKVSPQELEEAKKALLWLTRPTTTTYES